MNPLLNYLLQVTLISGVLYGYYHFALRNKLFHQYNRFYILTAFLLSILVPFLDITIYIPGEKDNPSIFLQTITSFQPTSIEEEPVLPVINNLPDASFSWQDIPVPLYCLVACLIFCRIVVSLYRLRKIIKNNPTEKFDTLCFVNTNEPGTPYSFFRWLFWNKKIELHSEKGQQMFRHELFHIRQKHSLDILFSETISMLLWINPFFYFLKKELKTIHEFLADQYAIKNYTDWKYAELLVMQALGTRQQLINPFFHNQIKRRIAMITTSQKPRHQYLRKLMVLPITALAVLLFAFHYKKQSGPIKQADSKPITVIIDAGHGGKDNGAIATDGTREKDIVLAIAKKIRSLNENQNIKIVMTRSEDVLPDLKSRSDISKLHKADLFISLHMDAIEGQKGSQIEILIPGNKNTWFGENKILASILFGYLNQLHPAKSSITDAKMISVLKNSTCPSALIECGNLSSQEGLKFISDPSNQEKIAQNILNAIEQYAQQQASEDWEERKKIVSDTTRPSINLNKNNITGKLEGTYNGEKIKQILLYKPVGNIGLMMPGGKLIVLSPDQSEELKNKYGSILMKSLDIIDEKAESTTEDKIFSKIEIEPAFPGGHEKWASYLKQNLDIDIPVRNKAPKGEYSVIVQFVVNLDGSLKDIKPLTKYGYGMEEEAIRVIKNSPKWIPAIQNGKQVVAYHKIPVHFFPLKATVSFDPVKKAEINTVPVSPNPVQAGTPEIKLEELRRSNPISLLKPGDSADIVSYTFTIEHENGTTTEAHNKGHEFSEITKSLIANATAGRMIIIDRIRVMKKEMINDIESTKEIKMPGKVYKIVN